MKVHGTNADEVERVSMALMTSLPESRMEQSDPITEELHEAAFLLEAVASRIEKHLKEYDECLRDSSTHPRDSQESLKQSMETFFRFSKFYPNATNLWPSLQTNSGLSQDEIMRRYLNDVYSFLTKCSGFVQMKLSVSQAKKSSTTAVHHHYGDEHYGDKHMGDIYKDNIGAAFGPHATANDTNIAVWRAAEQSIDLDALVASLATLRPKLRAEDPSDEHEDERLQISAAEKAAKQGDKKKVLQHLKEAGKWVLDVAKDVSEEVAAKAIATAMGLSG